MKHRIAQLLMEHLNASHVTVQDDSASHAGHQGIDKHTNSHFAVTIISDIFDKKTRIQRHRLVYKHLAGPIKDGVHAIQINAKTPKESLNV